MTERQYERRDIILRLIGRITGVGETNRDKEALKNLDFAEEVIICVLEDLKSNAIYDGFEGSMIQIKEKSKGILSCISEIIENED